MTTPETLVQRYLAELLSRNDLDAVAQLRVIALLFRYESLTEAELVPQMGGRNPSHVHAYLLQLAQLGICRRPRKANRMNTWVLTDEGSSVCLDQGLLRQAEWVKRLAEAVSYVEDQVMPRLPPPHLRNFEWRFSTDGLRVLIDQIYSDAAFNFAGSFAALNTPLCAFFAWKVGMSKRITLYDRNERILDLARHLTDERLEPIHFEARDIEQLPLKGSHQIVVMDPPWFPEYYTRYIAQLPRFVRSPAYVYALMQPRLTRASSLTERSAILMSFLHHNFVPIAYHPSLVGYAVNEFEAATFRSGNVQLDDEWNYGDLLCLCSLAPANSPVDSMLITDANWVDYYLVTQVVSVRKDGAYEHNKSALPEFHPASPDAIFPSISGREHEHLLQDFQIWTSRNRIYRVNRTDLWHVVCRALQDQIWTYQDTFSFLTSEGMSQDVVQAAISELFADADFIAPS